MDITLIHVPNPVEKTIQLQWQQLSQETIEIVIAELYRNDNITFKEAQNLLQTPSWQETVAILEKHGCTLYYDRDDFEHDLAVLDLNDE